MVSYDPAKLSKMAAEMLTERDELLAVAPNGFFYRDSTGRRIFVSWSEAQAEHDARLDFEPEEPEDEYVEALVESGEEKQ